MDDAHEHDLHLRHVNTRLRVIADESMLSRALGCLLSHAVEVTPSGGVLLGCRARGGHVVIEVWDSRPGIPQAQRADLFTPGTAYGQNLTDRGLGLVLAHRLSSAMAGQLSVYCSAAGGCVMRLVLPQAPK
ncbi:MAG: hypothetical protein BSR46_17105 [Candidatus Dactylopiibacterium carminicum]|nr:MAG: hypothetical protein BSR46_17105 [Candidatus Dactylopiibacterium carminicum]